MDQIVAHSGRAYTKSAPTSTILADVLDLDRSRAIRLRQGDEYSPFVKAVLPLARDGRTNALPAFIEAMAVIDAEQLQKLSTPELRQRESQIREDLPQMIADSTHGYYKEERGNGVNGKLAEAFYELELIDRIIDGRSE